jgi:hypothetical protein
MPCLLCDFSGKTWNHLHRKIDILLDPNTSENHLRIIDSPIPKCALSPLNIPSRQMGALHNALIDEMSQSIISSSFDADKLRRTPTPRFMNIGRATPLAHIVKDRPVPPRLRKVGYQS